MRLGPGMRVVAKDGTTYITKGPNGSTLVRERPKVKGKAARRADKLRRRLAREQTRQDNAKIYTDVGREDEPDDTVDPGYEAWCQEQSEL